MKGYTPPHTDFDYDAVEGSRMPIMDDEDAIKSEVHSRLSDVVSAMFRWITDCRYTGRAGQARVGRRFIAFAWVVNPSLFGGPSASALAERLALSPPMFRLLTGEVAKEFGITNAAQRHAWNRGRIAPQRRSGPRGPQGHTQGTKTPYKPSQRQERAKESLSRGGRRGGQESEPQTCAV